MTVGTERARRAVAEAAEVVIELTPSPIALENLVVTATISERAAAEALRPVSVMAGDDLQRQMTATVAGTLASMPGLAATRMGPSVAQPVIRGLSGDRVLMLEDGTAVGDASSQGADHTTALDPSSARRIEVVRGPGALLYGGNALGGVINVIRDEIPTTAPARLTGAASLQTQSATGSLAGSASGVFAIAERVPLRVEVAARTAGDLKTPAGTLLNTDGELLSAGVRGRPGWPTGAVWGRPSAPTATTTASRVVSWAGTTRACASKWSGSHRSCGPCSMTRPDPSTTSASTRLTPGTRTASSKQRTSWARSSSSRTRTRTSWAGMGDGDRLRRARWAAVRPGRISDTGDPCTRRTRVGSGRPCTCSRKSIWARSRSSRGCATTGAWPIRGKIGQLLRHLAGSVRHQKYHDTDILTVRVEAPGA
ncbi:MAG: TonB-dependent receptor plug domain-containing protein [Gammaproteobacteria bacterium]|nr:TonB-dependent receptor plug domain-containing protein [Gammaproteobacteria bacterium]